MTPFVAPTDDILFSLRDVAGAGDLPDWDDDLARDILSAFAAFAEREIAPLDEEGDRQGCRLENGCVRMPDGFDKIIIQMISMQQHHVLVGTGGLGYEVDEPRAVEDARLTHDLVVG